MVILQLCVVCGKSVDVDNCFGSISKDETFCSKHMKFAEIFTVIRRLQHDVNQLSSHINEVNDYARNVICEAERSGKNKSYYDKEDKNKNE